MCNPSVSIPKLWFDVHNRVESSFDGQCDCECACPTSLVFDDTGLRKLLSVKLSAERNCDIVFNRDIFLAPLGSHWMALSAKGGQVVVWDDQIQKLLSHLPSTQQNLRAQFFEWPSAVFEQVVALLLATNVLSSPQLEDERCIQRDSDILVALLNLTGRCNLSCAYCYAARSEQQMDITTAQRAVDAVFRSALAHGYTCVKLKYAGGEPTLNFAALRSAQRRAETLSAQTGIGLDAVLLTNGVCITDAQMDALLAHDIRVTVSLDGVGAYQDVQRPLVDGEGGSFHHVARTLDCLLARGLSPHISVTITKQSLAGLPSLVQYLLDRELRFSFNFYREPDRSLARDPLSFEPDEMIEGLKAAFRVIEMRLPEHSLLSTLTDRANLGPPHLRTCGVGRNYMIIDCAGRVAKCQMDVDQSITSIEAHDPLALVRADTAGIQNLTVDAKECRECPWRYYCAGGCPRLTFQRTGRYDAKSPLCEVYRAILPEVVRLEGLRLVRYGDPWSFESAIH